MPAVAVTKMHGTLNDFVILDRRAAKVADLETFARIVCDRHAGVGADGVIAIETSKVADAAMRIINADGSEAEMCGNGMRCAIRYLSERGEGDRFRIETVAGTIAGEVIEKGGLFAVRIDMGIPLFEEIAIPFDDAHFVSMGNPHVVVFRDHLDRDELLRIAHELQRSPHFPGGTNVHTVVVRDEHVLEVLHWERGAGLTMACGTGVVACATAASRLGRIGLPADIDVPGGRLHVALDRREHALLTGPAARVFDTVVQA